MPPITEEGDGLQHGTDLLYSPLRPAALVVVAAEAVHPAQQPASVAFGFLVKFLQQLGGDWEVFLKRFEAQDKFGIL